MIRRPFHCICLLFLLSLWLLSSLSQATIEASATNPVPSVSHLLGKPAPPFHVVTFDGRQISLAEFSGKAVLVNFWATWCGACSLEMPWLAQLREQYTKQRFEVLGILTDDASDDKVKQITDRYGVKYPILRCNHKTAQAYGGLPDLPESFFVDRHGRVVAELSAADSKQEIETNIQKALRFSAK